MISIFIVTLNVSEGSRREAAGFFASLRMTWYGA